MVEGIRESSLSPLEKYMAVYNIVTRFKKYREEPKHAVNLYLSRNLKYILNANSPYIVCVGFANLLVTLLEKAEIDSIYFSEKFDISYDKGTISAKKPLKYADHVIS